MPSPTESPFTWSVAPTLKVLALRTPTLPPATATNAVLAGHAPWVVDPATPHAAERDRLVDALEALRDSGEGPRGIVLTHHHADHIGAAAYLSERLGLEIWAHARTAELIADTLTVSHTLADGDDLEGWRVLHTPGHASGHIVLFDEVRGFMVGGDMLASVGTIVVDPPDGHMATYLASLARLRELGPKVIVPAHGAPIDRPVALIDHYVAHRLQREAKVASALGPEPRPLDLITRAAYPELAPALLPLAARSALAHLEKLWEEGRAAPHEAPVDTQGRRPTVSPQLLWRAA